MDAERENVKNKETGEFELVVGNGQIISGFFILALLLAVFFAMGFIVARAKYQQEPAGAPRPHRARQPELRQQPAAAQPPRRKPPAGYEERLADAPKTPPSLPLDAAAARHAAAETAPEPRPASGGTRCRELIGR